VLHFMLQPGEDTLPQAFVRDVDDDCYYDYYYEEVDFAAMQDYKKSEHDCRRILSRATYDAILGGHVECARLMLAFARPWLSTMMDSTWSGYHTEDGINWRINELLAYYVDDHTRLDLKIDPAITQVINAEIDIIEALEEERKELKARDLRNWLKERNERKELEELEELEAYAAEVAEFWF
jgi:hypothetical protein